MYQVTYKGKKKKIVLLFRTKRYAEFMKKMIGEFDPITKPKIIKL